MFDVDDSAWPIVSVRVSGNPSEDDVRGFLARLDGWLGRGERFGLLIDMRAAAASEPEAAQRELVLAHMRAKAELTGRWMVQAVVHEKPVHRAFYSLMSAIFPMPFPTKPFPEPESARLWLVDKLQSLSGAGRGR